MIAGEEAYYVLAPYKIYLERDLVIIRRIVFPIYGVILSYFRASSGEALHFKQATIVGEPSPLVIETKRIPTVQIKKAVLMDFAQAER